MKQVTRCLQDWLQPSKGTQDVLSIALTSIMTKLEVSGVPAYVQGTGIAILETFVLSLSHTLLQFGACAAD